jgi:hypothetical protein
MQFYSYRVPAFVVPFRVLTFCFDAAGRFTRSIRRMLRG